MRLLTILLQQEATGIFGALMQQGILFGFMGFVIFILARRVVQLEKKIENMTEDKFEEIKDNTLLIQNATNAMTKVAKTRCKYDEEKE